jgi:hypothetical protein
MKSLIFEKLYEMTLQLANRGIGGTTVLSKKIVLFLLK